MRAFPLHPEWPKALRDILAQASELGNAAVLAFDLDSTLFDNRPRQAKILREFGSAQNVPELLGSEPSDFDSGWDLRGPMRKRGMTERAVEQLYPALKAFWQERFFTSPYCTDDVAIQGAAEFCQTLVQTGAVLCYVTGRHEGMRVGTVAAMRQSGLPPPGPNVRLLMKPKPDGDDDAFKRVAHAELANYGKLLAAFDNEPTHANDYRKGFPDAVVVHLATDHSGRPVELLDGIISAPHFDHQN